VGLSGKTLGWRPVTDPNELLDINAAAKFLSVSETSLRRWTNSGVLPCLRVGKRRERRFRRADLLAFMEQPGAAPRQAAPKVGYANGQHSRNEPLTVTHGNHLLGIYASDTGRISLCVPFLLDGLREGSACLLIGPRRARNQIVKNLGDLHPTLASDTRKGRLVFCDYEKSAKAQWKTVEAHLTTAQEAGASSFRVVGDVTAMRALVSPKALIEYETGFDDRIVARFPVDVLCLYDAREFSGLELLNALKTHPQSLRNPLGRSLA
jgi:transcriptional repressor of dcmA and dcmR